MAIKCFNKNLKEYKELLSKYKSDSTVNAIITKYQYNNGTDSYPSLEEAEYIFNDKSFKNYSLNQELLNSLEIRKKNLKKELGNREITNKIYVENKTKIDRLVREIEKADDEIFYTKTISFANDQFKDIEDALNSGKVDKANIASKVRFLSEAKKYFSTYDSLRYIDVENLSDKFKLLHYKFSTDLTSLEKRIQEESFNAVIDIVENPLSEQEKKEANIPELLSGDIKDINTLEYQFGAMATSTNAILASMDRAYKSVQTSNREEFENDSAELIEKSKSIEDFSFMRDGNSKYIITEINSKFYEDREKLMKQFPTVDENGDRIEYKVVSSLDTTKQALEDRLHNIKLKENKKVRSEWYKENTEFTDEFATEFNKYLDGKWIIETKVTDKQGKYLFSEYEINSDLNETQYKQLEHFLESQFDASTSYKIDKEGNVTSIIEPYTEDGKINYDLSGWRPKTNNFKPKLSKWKDERYTQLINGKSKESEYYRTYIRLYEKYGNKVPEYSYKPNQMISMQRNWIDSIIENPSLANIKDKFITNTDNVSTIKRDENGNIIPTGLKLLYTGSIEENLKDKINQLETKKQNITDQVQLDKINFELNKLYSSIDLSEINTNTTESLLNYMNMASKYEFKHKLESQANLVLNVLKGKESYTIDYFTDKVRPSDNRVANRMSDWINARIYDDVRADSDLISSKIIDTASKLTSISGIGFNFKSALGNTLTATFNNFIEGFGGQFYNVKDYLKGKSLATINTQQVLTNLANGKNTKVNALMDKLGIFEKFNPVNPNDATEKISWKSKMTTDVAFMAQNASEYYVQSSVALAAMQSHRIVNDRIINKGEFLDSKLGSEEEFNRFPTVWESIDFKDNKIVYNSDLNKLINTDKTKDELFLFSQRIIGINQKIHGRYTADDANRLQQFALGRMFQQFKRWASAGVEERFTKKHYDYRLRTDIEGRYVTMYRIVSSIKKEGLKAALNWNNKTELEKSNMKKLLAEVSAIIVTAIIAHLAKNAAKDMDDEDEYLLRKAVNFSAYMSNRVNTELSTFYTPNLALTASNAPILGNLKELSDFGKAVLFYPFINDEKRYYQRGTNKDRLKLEKEFGDLVPVWKDVSFYNSLDVQGDYYFAR